MNLHQQLSGNGGSLLSEQAFCMCKSSKSDTYAPVRSIRLEWESFREVGGRFAGVRYESKSFVKFKLKNLKVMKLLIEAETSRAL